MIFKVNGIDVAEEYCKDNLKFPLSLNQVMEASIDTFLIEDSTDLKDYHFQNDKFMF
jgi:hypothetical protein